MKSYWEEEDGQTMEPGEQQNNETVNLVILIAFPPKLRYKRVFLYTILQYFRVPDPLVPKSIHILRLLYSFRVVKRRKKTSQIHLVLNT